MNGFDPAPRARPVFSFPRAQTLARIVRDAEADPETPTWRARVRQLPPLVTDFSTHRASKRTCRSERSRSFTYDEIVARDKVNLDITWLRDESLEDVENLPAPEAIACEIVADLTAALAEFEAVATALEEVA